MEQVDSVLLIIEKSIKRLAVPTAMIVAALLLVKGADANGQDFSSIAVPVFLVCFSAFTFICGSLFVAINELINLKPKKGLFVLLAGAPFAGTYIILAIAAGAVAFGETGGI